MSGGVEIAARMTRLAPQAGDGDTPIALLSLDQKNAFKTSRRDNILASLKDGLPELCRLFVTFHSFSSELRSGTGELLGYSHTGVHQGDPLGGTYHNMGFPTALVLGRLFAAPCLETESRHAQFSLFTTTPMLLWHWSRRTQWRGIVDVTFQEDGLQLNPNKCKIVSKEWLQDAAYTGLVQDGLVMLGTPLGFGDYKQRKSVELFTKKLDSLPALRTINPHCAIRLLDRCVNQRVQYTCPAPQSSKELDTSSATTLTRRSTSSLRIYSERWPLPHCPHRHRVRCHHLSPLPSLAISECTGPCHGSWVAQA